MVQPVAVYAYTQNLQSTTLQKKVNKYIKERERDLSWRGGLVPSELARLHLSKPSQSNPSFAMLSCLLLATIGFRIQLSVTTNFFSSSSLPDRKKVINIKEMKGKENKGFGLWKALEGASTFCFERRPDSKERVGRGRGRGQGAPLFPFRFGLGCLLGLFYFCSLFWARMYPMFKLLFPFANDYFGFFFSLGNFMYTFKKNSKLRTSPSKLQNYIFLLKI